MQDLVKKHVWGVSGDSVYVLLGESICGFVCKILVGNTAVPTWQGLGYCTSPFWLWAVRVDGDVTGISCILGALRKEQEGAKQLEGPVLSLCPFSPCKFWGEGGDKSSGTKEELDPMGWWSRAKSNAYFIYYEYSEAGRTSLQASFLLGKSRYKALAWSLRKGQA